MSAHAATRHGPEGSDIEVTASSDLSGARRRIETASGALDIFDLAWLLDQTPGPVLPFTVRILLEDLLRRAGTRDVSVEDVLAGGARPRRKTSRSCRHVS